MFVNVIYSSFSLFVIDLEVGPDRILFRDFEETVNNISVERKKYRDTTQSN